MNQLTKLIEQYERENPEEKATYQVTELMYEVSDQWSKNFVRWLASRPTCGKEQRLFLDEVENNFLPIDHDDYDIIEHNKGNSALESWDFGEIDFEKVIKGE